MDHENKNTESRNKFKHKENVEFSKEDKNWKCQACTFINTKNEFSCEMCTMSRYGNPSQQLQRAQSYPTSQSLHAGLLDQTPKDDSCFLCGKNDDVKLCEYCNKKCFCGTCNTTYHSHPHRLWHLKLEIKDAKTKEFISVDNILQRLNDAMSEHQTQSNNTIEETEKDLTNCYTKLKKFYKIKLKMKKTLSKERESFNKDEEKQFQKLENNLRKNFDDRKKLEWQAIGEEELEWVKTQFKMSKQQAVDNFQHKAIGMRVIWESKLDKEWEEYLTECKQAFSTKMKEKWKIKKKSITDSFLDEESDKEIAKIYQEMLEEINSILEKYKITQRENVEELNDSWKEQDVLIHEVESLKQKIINNTEINCQLNQEVSKINTEIIDERNTNAALKQQLHQMTKELEKQKNLFKEKEQNLQDSVKYIEKVKEVAENKWDQDRMKLEKENGDLRNTIIAWRNKYYDEQKEYLQTIEILNSSECRLQKKLEQTRRLVTNLMQEKETLKNELSKFGDQINSIKRDFECKQQKYKEEILKWQNICRTQHIHFKPTSSFNQTGASSFRPTFDEAIGPSDSQENNNRKTSKQLDVITKNELKYEIQEKQLESCDLKPESKLKLSNQSVFSEKTKRKSINIEDEKFEQILKKSNSNQIASAVPSDPIAGKPNSIEKMVCYGSDTVVQISNKSSSSPIFGAGASFGPTNSQSIVAKGSYETSEQKNSIMMATLTLPNDEKYEIKDQEKDTDNAQYAFTKDQNNEQLLKFENEKKIIKMAEKNLKEIKSGKSLAAVHEHKKSPDGTVHEMKSITNKLASMCSSVQPETGELIDLNISLPAANNNYQMLANFTDLVEITKPFKQTHEKTSRDSTDPNQLAPASASTSNCKDNDTDKSGITSSVDDSHQVGEFNDETRTK